MDNVSNTDIQNQMHEIKMKYGNDAYRLVSDKSDYDDVRGTKLWELWYSNGEHDLSISNLDFYYMQYCQGIYSSEIFRGMLNKLSDALAHEFEHLQ